MTRNKKITVRVNEEEQERFSKVPDRNKKIRNFLNAEVEKIDTPLSEQGYKELVLIRRQIQGIATNINQIAKVAMTDKELSESKEKELEELRYIEKKLIAKINGIIKVWEF